MGFWFPFLKGTQPQIPVPDEYPALAPEGEVNPMFPESKDSPGTCHCSSCKRIRKILYTVLGITIIALIISVLVLLHVLNVWHFPKLVSFLGLSKYLRVEPDDAVPAISNPLSPEYLTRLGAEEAMVHAKVKVIADKIQGYPGAAPEFSQTIQAYLDDYGTAWDQATELARTKSTGQELNRNTIFIEITKHPFLVYKMVRRFVKVLPNMESQTKRVETIVHINDLMIRADNSFEWPNPMDLEVVIQGILRIVHVYDIDVKMFVMGNILGTDTGVSLSTAEVKEIGEYAGEISMYSSAILFLETAREMALGNLNESNATDLLESIQTSIQNAEIDHDQSMDSAGIHPHFFKDKVKEGTSSQGRITQRKYLYSQFVRENGINFANETIGSWGLCSGHNHQTAEERSKLSCWYESQIHGAWRIGPVKMELLSSSPSLLQIHEFLGSRVIQDLKVKASPTLARSVVQNTNGRSGSDEGSASSTRTSVQSWLYGELPMVNRRIELISGLSVLRNTSSEALQVASYVFGGHYDLHLDSLRCSEAQVKSCFEQGDRTATFMFYLDDTEKGGYTAFPNLGVAVRPVKGTGLLWYNLLKNGQYDTRTYHTACPVVLGHKWIATKWIRSFDQAFRRKCSLDPNE